MCRERKNFVTNPPKMQGGFDFDMKIICSIEASDFQSGITV